MEGMTAEEGDAASTTVLSALTNGQAPDCGNCQYVGSSHYTQGFFFRCIGMMHWQYGEAPGKEYHFGAPTWGGGARHRAHDSFEE